MNKYLSFGSIDASKADILCLLLLVFFAISGCSGDTDAGKAYIKAKFTVADTVDRSGNFESIGLTIIKKDSANADADTLFHQVTDSLGNLSGWARVPERGRYPAMISRNDQNIGRFGLILSEGDTLNISGELPNLEATLDISSREHDALDVYNRVQQGYRRVARFAQAGRIKGDTLAQELQKWSDLFWEVYENHDHTLAGQLAADESIRLLQGWNNEAMLARIRQIQDKPGLIGTAANYAKPYLAENQGLDYTLSYLDTLRSYAEESNVARRVAMEQVKLLYDSARIDQAKDKLASFREEFELDPPIQSWVKSMTYDLNYLSPGDTIPSFRFELNGDIISRDSLMGTPYLLEITALSNSLYQEQFERTVVIHSLYKNYGLQVITIPLDNSQVTVDAFFEERVRAWPVAPAQAFERQELLEKFNIQLIPTRFLIDQNGQIVRKFVGREYADVIRGIQSIINKKEPES